MNRWFVVGAVLIAVSLVLDGVCIAVGSVLLFAAVPAVLLANVCIWTGVWQDKHPAPEPPHVELHTGHTVRIIRKEEP